jgi:hypothetical protein
MDPTCVIPLPCPELANIVGLPRAEAVEFSPRTLETTSPTVIFAVFPEAWSTSKKSDAGTIEEDGKPSKSLTLLFAITYNKIPKEELH